MRTLGTATLTIVALLSAHGLTAEEKPGLKIDKQAYGKMPDGAVVDQYTLATGAGLTVKLITYGAMITAVETPDRHGTLSNITLHRDTLEDYLAGHPLFGCVVGRYANRIAGARFTIDGVEYRLAANSGSNHIHGGRTGFHKYVWKAEPVQNEDLVGVKLSHTSPDGDEGYPGELAVTVTYSVNGHQELKMDYTATTTKPTHVNLTNHAYWNLAGAGSGDVLGHEVVLNADKYLPPDQNLIPVGPPQGVQGTPLDFTSLRTIGQRIDQTSRGYDHCYVVKKQPGDRLQWAVRVHDPTSGREMEVFTTQPGVQLYTANGLKMKDKSGKLRYGNHAGLCLETQHYPDSPNRPDFPSTLLRPGETYRETTVYKFSVR